MKLIFRPEDFPAPSSQLAQWSCFHAQSIFNIWLAENSKVVYFSEHFPHLINIEVPPKVYYDTHRALLVCIEPIEVCKHEKEKVSLNEITADIPACRYWRCSCGAKVEPVEFKAVEK